MMRRKSRVKGKTSKTFFLPDDLCSDLKLYVALKAKKGIKTNETAVITKVLSGFMNKELPKLMKQ